MPQDTLKKLRADMEARFVRVEALLPFGYAPQTTMTTANAHGMFGAGGLNVDGSITLPDGTKQFPNAPTGPVVNTVPNTTPAVPKEYGVGAVVQWRHMFWSVVFVGDGVFEAECTDTNSGEVMKSPFLYPRDVVLVTPAP